MSLQNTEAIKKLKEEIKKRNKEKYGYKKSDK